jgi:hypothetical protein
MTAITSDAIAHRIDSIKGLYAELFLLMDQSMREDPLTEATGALDCAIEQLMVTIDLTMKEFRREVDEARQRRRLTEDVDRALLEFDGQLREGLELMIARVRQRVGFLAQERDQLKGRLQTIRQTWRGAKGYRPRAGSNMLIDSKI